MENYSYKSSAFRINVGRQDNNNIWDVVVENRLSGSGVQLKKMGKELSLNDAKFFAVRLVLPLIWNKFSDNSLNWLLPINSLENIELSSPQITQVFAAEQDKHSNALINAHILFAKSLVQDALGREYRTHFIDKSRGAGACAGRDALENLFDIFLDDSDRRNFSQNITNAENLSKICHSWAFYEETVADLNLQISTHYNSQNYSDRKLASFSQYYLNGPLFETLRLRRSFESYGSTSHGLLNLLEHAISLRKGFSFIRIGEGEGSFSSYSRYMKDRSRKNEVFGVIGKDIYSIWFKRNIADLAAKDYTELKCAYSHSVQIADYLGIPSSSRIIYEYSQLEQDLLRYGYSRGYVGVREVLLDAYDILKGDLNSVRVIGSCDVARAMYSWQDAEDSLEVVLPKVLYGLDRLHIISCHPQLATVLQSFLCIDEVNSILIPPEKGRLSASNMLDGDHLEHFFAPISEKCKAMEGQVVLVAAGFLGKIYCALIKEAGGVAIDIGSLADFWAGYSTRAKTTSSLISPFCCN